MEEVYVKQPLGMIWKMIFNWEKQILHFLISVKMKIYSLSKFMLMILSLEAKNLR